MSKSSIKVELNSKIICTKKFQLDEHLYSIREKIKDKIKNGLFLDKEGNPIDKEDEKDFLLEEIIDNNILKIKQIEQQKDSSIKILLNDKDFCVINCSEDENLDTLRKLLSNNIQDFEFLDEDGNPKDKDDEKEYTIKEML